MSIMQQPTVANITILFNEVRPSSVNVAELASFHGQRPSFILTAQGAPIAIIQYHPFQLELLFEEMPNGCRYRVTVDTREHWEKLVDATLIGLNAALDAGGKPYAFGFNYDIHLIATTKEEMDAILQDIFPTGPFYETISPTFRTISLVAPGWEPNQEIYLDFSHINDHELKAHLNVHYNNIIPRNRDEVWGLFNNGYSRFTRMLSPLLERR